MATDKIIRDIVGQIKRTLQFLDNLPKLDKKLRPEKELLVKELHDTIRRCTDLVGNTPEKEFGESYDDVSGVGSGLTQDEVYNDVNEQPTTYDDLGPDPSNNASSQQENGGDVYDDTDIAQDGNYDDLSAPIVDTPCEKLINPTKADYLELKKEAGLAAKLIKSPWQKRWCVVHKGVLYMYESAKDKKQKDSFRLSGFQFKTREDISKEAKRKERCFELRSNNKVYEFCACDKDNVDKWRLAFGGTAVTTGSAGGRVHNDLKASAAAPGSGGGEVYDDTTAPSEIYEDTVGGANNYADTAIGHAENNDGDVYEDTAVTSAPPLQQRRPSAREELPHLPTSSRPAIPIPTKPMASTNSAALPLPPPTLPPRDESGSSSGSIAGSASGTFTGSASGTFSRPGIPLPPTLNTPQRGVPEPPKMESRHNSPCLPPLPPPEDLEPEGDPDLEGFGDCKDDYNNMYQGMWDCYPEEDNELMFKRGEIIHILSREYEGYGWWVAENASDDIGLVPVSYIMKAYDI